MKKISCLVFVLSLLLTPIASFSQASDDEFDIQYLTIGPGYDYAHGGLGLKLESRADNFSLIGGLGYDIVNDGGIQYGVGASIFLGQSNVESWYIRALYSQIIRYESFGGVGGREKVQKYYGGPVGTIGYNFQLNTDLLLQVGIGASYNSEFAEQWNQPEFSFAFDLSLDFVTGGD